MDDSSILRRRGLQVRISLLLKHKSSSGFLKFTGIKGRTLRIWLEVIDLVNGSRKECRKQNTFRLFLTHISVHTASLFSRTIEQSLSCPITLPAGIRKESIPTLSHTHSQTRTPSIQAYPISVWWWSVNDATARRTKTIRHTKKPTEEG